MDYRRLQTEAHQENRNLLAAFAAIITIVAAVAAAVIAAVVWACLGLLELFAAAEEAAASEAVTLTEQLPWSVLYLAAAVFVAGVIVWVSIARERSLRKLGGDGIARMLGGRRIDERSPDPAERRFVNAVAEMAIAARRAAPAVFVLDGERSINVFNAGWTDETTAIGITGGAVSSLERDELQAVAAQAMSHIFHGDARLNLRLMALVTGVAGLAMVGEDWIEASKPDEHRRDDDGVVVPLMVAGGLLYAVGWIGVALSNAVQRSVARRHELLADATAVELLRQRDPMRNALRRVGGHPRRGALTHRRARSMNHLFMVNGRRTERGGVHPDLRLRILRLDPSWTGSWLEAQVRDVSSDPAPDIVVERSATDVLAPIPGLDVLTRPLAEPFASLDNGLGAVGGSVLGVVATEVLMADVMAAPVIDEPHTTEDALAALAAVVAEAGGPPDASAEERARDIARAAGVLRAAGASVSGVLDCLRPADDLDHWIVHRLISGHLNGPPEPAARPRSLERLKGEFAIVLTMLAAIGGGDQSINFAVGAAAADCIGLQPRSAGSLSLARLDRALEKLERLDERDCKRVRAGMEATTRGDGRSKRTEREFVAAVGIALPH